MFTKKKMNEKDIEFEEPLEDGIPVFDKRRYSARGERLVDDEPVGDPVKSFAHTELEATLKTEIERRQAAETILRARSGPGGESWPG